MTAETKNIKPIILLVDDDPMVLKATVRKVGVILRHAGAEAQVEVWKAQSLKEAIGQTEILQAALGSSGRYLLVTNGNMPGGNGDQVVVKVRELLGKNLSAAAIYTGNPNQFASVCSELEISCIEKTDPDALGRFVQLFLARL